MRIECPACGAEYEVPEKRLAPGLLVRCVRCKNDWSPPPPAPPVEPEPEPPQPESPRAESPQAESPRAESPRAEPSTPPVETDDLRPPRRLHERVPLLAVAWALSIVLLMGLAYAAVAGRDGVTRAWPASASASQALGLRPRSALVANPGAGAAADEDAKRGPKPELKSAGH
ncbi:MAG: hypothetical protein NVSMB18_35710 [Acetobacteraceae bacterium]